MLWSALKVCRHLGIRNNFWLSFNPQTIRKAATGVTKMTNCPATRTWRKKTSSCSDTSRSWRYRYAWLLRDNSGEGRRWTLAKLDNEIASAWESESCESGTEAARLEGIHVNLNRGENVVRKSQVNSWLVVRDEAAGSQRAAGPVCVCVSKKCRKEIRNSCQIQYGY